MDKSLGIFIFAATLTKDSDGRVTGDFCLCCFLDIMQCLMDKSLEIFSLRLLGHEAVFDEQLDKDSV